MQQRGAVFTIPTAFGGVEVLRLHLGAIIINFVVNLYVFKSALTYRTGTPPQGFNQHY